MKNAPFYLLLLVLAACGGNTQPTVNDTITPAEPHRPLAHFSPRAHWMNDPNGLVFFNNTYHLFYQYYPDSTVWGPMHWGHASSKDLASWQHQPIALYPDSLGYIFSGSVVVDSNNTSGFGQDGKIPLIAIFTHHDTAGANARRIDYQNQSIAYSLDEGQTWTKYAGNPVLKNPGIVDFRDPKVSYYEAGKKWIMTLATKDRITFYSSKNLKEWTKESEFGQNIGAHGGVWECPDLFPMEHHGEKVWVLLVSINPGGPNGGSATQYFTGSFDGKTFTPFQTDIRWIDYGPDDYAGVTFFNTGKRRLFLGWMSNWDYAQSVPTVAWRSAMTVPRDLQLEKMDGKYFVTSKPVDEINGGAPKEFQDSTTLEGPVRLDLALAAMDDYQIVLSNDSNEQLVIGYDKAANNYYIDRSKSGKIDFHAGFAKKITAPRIAVGETSNLTLIIDVASAEVFADNGLTVLTGIFFPNSVYNKMKIVASAASQAKAMLRPVSRIGLDN